MRGLTTFARYLVQSALLVCVISLAAPCAAQELDAPAAPAAPDAGDGRGSVFVPGGFLGLVTPVGDRAALNVYGFYYGEVAVPVAQVDVPVQMTKFLTITPSYLYNWVPASGLNKMTPQPLGATDSYEENQFRIDGTVTFPIQKFEISARNMYVRRFREGAANDIGRYRGRIGIAHPLAVGGRTWKPFASYESFYERKGGWNRDRIWSGVTIPVTRQLMFQPSYMWERSQGNRDVNYVLLGLIVNTK